MADLDNARKRAQREKEELQKFGQEKMLKDLLTIVDNFDRAMEHAGAATDLPSFVQGMEMTRRQLEDALGKQGLKHFDALGKLFDPNVHEAMQQVESAEVPHNHVCRQVLRGFTLNERLLRPALVVVARAPKEPGETAPSPVESQEESRTEEI